MRFKNKTAFAALISMLILTALLSGCAGIEFFHYNNISVTSENAPKAIEGSYTKEMDVDEFETLTGLMVRQSLPKAYQSEPVTVVAEYDEDDKIINLTAGIGSDDNGYPIAVSAYSAALWSPLGYSLIGDSYASAGSDLEVSTIDQRSCLFYRYDDTQNDNKLGYSVYIGQVDINGIYVYIEAKAMPKADFEEFATALIFAANAQQPVPSS